MVHMTSTTTPATTPLQPVADEKNLLAPAEGTSCCGGGNCG
jgi:hypothetical protein